MVKIAGGQEKFKLVVTVFGDDPSGPETEKVEFAPYDTAERAAEIAALFKKKGYATDVVTVYTCGSVQAFLRTLTGPAYVQPETQPVAQTAREEPKAGTPEEPDEERVPDQRKPGPESETPSIESLLAELNGEAAQPQPEASPEDVAAAEAQFDAEALRPEELADEKTREHRLTLEAALDEAWTVGPKFVHDVAEAYDQAVVENGDRLAVELGNQQVADAVSEPKPKSAPRRAAKKTAAKKQEPANA